MCKTAKDNWQSLLITHQGNSHVKDNKIDLLVQQYEQFTILEEEYIDSGFARFNSIITSFKALDEGFSSKNYVRKFLRALHTKWRANVTTIEESKDLSSLALDELIGNLKVHKVVMEKDSEIYKGKKERVKSITLRAKKESSDDETLTSGRNQKKKRSNSDKEMRRKERVARNNLDAVIQIISLAIVQNHLATKIKRPSLEVLGAIVKMTPKTKPMMKLVSWLNRRMSSYFMHVVLIRGVDVYSDFPTSLQRGSLQLWYQSQIVNTRTDAELAAAVQNALQTLLSQIRAEIREEFRTGSGPSGSGGNPPPVTIHTWLECFNKQKPRSFENAIAPVDAENWISHMEKIFDVMGCEDAFKTRLAVYKFEGDALA
nr:zinc finger, CCHC-type, retrotransposon Gag domain protein [Tanacetum cinerariifolium]